MLNWKDETSYSRNAKERVPSSWGVEVNGFKLLVHRHIHYPETWLLSCYDLGIDKRDLYTNDLDEAKKKALEVIIGRLGTYVKLEQILREEYAELKK